MNPNRFAEDRDFASDVQGYGMRMNVFSRVFEIDRHLDQVQSSIEKLRIFRDKHEEGDLSGDVRTGAFTGVKRLMRSLDAIEYAFPELENEVWFSGFQNDVHHAYWRIEDGRYDGVLDSNTESVDSFAGEVVDILSNISDSTHTNPVNQLHRFIKHYGKEFDPYNAPEEYYNEVFEARDLFCLGYYSTALIVFGRAVERSLLQLGEARKINSLHGFEEDTSWKQARFYERTKALKNNDMPDDSGKMITNTQYHLIQILINYRNKVAHEEYRDISREEAARLMGQAVDLLTELEEQRIELEETPDEEINSLDNVSVPI
jgi:uncharacterized protein YutE (UPF0331/DUF86 family)